MAEEKAATSRIRPLSNTAQIASAVIALGSAVIALVALVGIGIQIYLLDRNAQRAAARQVYMSYSANVIRYPEYAEPKLEQIKKDPAKYVQYKAYVAHMLFAFDEVLNVEDTAEWRATFAWDLDDHKDYICEENRQGYWEMYYNHLRDRIERFKAQSCKIP